MKAGSPYIGKSEIIKDFATKNGIEIKEVNLVGRVGKTEKMKCGLDATIISYRNQNDIDVKFSDNTLVEHTSYHLFENGKVAHPTMDTPNYSKLGLKKKMACGKEAMIVGYRNQNDIDVEFEDKSILEHVAYDDFRKGELKM